MTEKEFSLKSILFLVIGLLLLLSLIICIYIVNEEKDLVKIEANVINVKKDKSGTGKNDITVSYEIDGVSYNYNFYYKDEVMANDKIDIYYHKNNINTVTTFKTSKFIFVCPIVGLILCIISLLEILKNHKSEVNELKALSIEDLGNTQRLEIETSDVLLENYTQLPEEKIEAEVKTIKKECSNNVNKSFKNGRNIFKRKKKN